MVSEEFKQFYHGKKVLVTGGAGFIGSHLVEKLVASGAHVTVFDNFSTGNLKNLTAVFNQISIMYADISNTFSTFKATIDKEIVFHLAACISVAQSIENPELCKRINAEGTTNILEGCRRNGVKTFIYSSSSAIYGNRNDACSEELQPNPQSPYAESKFEGECACKKYAEAHGINAASLRYFNVYGERQNPQGDYAAVVAKFTYALKNKLPLVIYGDGHQTRDFIHVSHVVDANLAMGMHENLNGNVFNIGTGKSITLLQLIEHLEAEHATKATSITHHPARMGDIQHSCASCQKYKNFMQKTL